MNYSAMYLCENFIIFRQKNTTELITYPLPKKTIKYGKINELKTFEKYFKKFHSEYKISSLFTNGMIKIICNDLYTNIDKKILEEICKENNYNKIIFINEKNIFNDYKNIIYINYNKNYIIIHEKNDNIIKTSFIIENENLFENYIKNIKNKKIFLYGEKFHMTQNERKNIYFYNETFHFLKKI